MKRAFIVLITAIMTLTLGLGLIIAMIAILCSEKVQGVAWISADLVKIVRVLSYYKCSTWAEQLDSLVFFNNPVNEAIKN